MYATALLIAFYSVLAFVSALLVTYRFRDVKIVAIAPVTYILVHTGYAIGFISGLFSRDVESQVRRQA